MAQQMNSNDILDLLRLLEVELCYLCADKEIELSEEVIRIISVLQAAMPIAVQSSDEYASNLRNDLRAYYDHQVSLRRDH